MRIRVLATLVALTVPAFAGEEYGLPTSSKAGYFLGPYAPNAGEVDVRGFPKGVEVKDPYTGKIILVPKGTEQEQAIESQKLAEAYLFKELNLEDVTVQEAFHFIAEKVGLKANYTPPAGEAKRVTLKLTDIPARAAFDYVARIAGQKAVYTPEGVSFVPLPDGAGDR